MALFFDKFTGFTTDDFAAFEEKKQQSNRFNLERLKVKEKMEALGRFLAGPIMDGMPEIKWGVTDHVPSLFNQRKVSNISLYFTRDEGQQRLVAPYVDSRVALPEQVLDAGEYVRNLSLYIRIDLTGIQVGLRCHSTAYVDVMNLAAALTSEDAGTEFHEILSRTDPELLTRLSPQEEQLITDVQPQQWEALGENVTQSTFFIAIYKGFNASDPKLQNAGFQDESLGLLRPLRDVFAFWLWSAKNDHLGLAKEIRTQHEVAKGKPVQLSEGSWVRVVSGLFSGRRGKVLDLDHKGVVRVKIGKLVVRLSFDEIRLPERRQNR